MWKATAEQLKELKFVLNSKQQSHLYYWDMWEYEFNTKTNELFDFNDGVSSLELVVVIESFEHFKQVMKILLTEKLHNSTWEDEIRKLTEQIENL